MIYVDVSRCYNLSIPSNGRILSCNSGDNIKSTCNLACNTGYVLTGSNARTCQNDGSWNGTETMCRKGIINMYMTCGSFIHSYVLLYSL